MPTHTPTEKAKSSPSPQKARKMLKDGVVRGKPLSAKQKRFLHHIEGGKR